MLYPLTEERSHTGKGMPTVAVDQESGADWVEITGLLNALSLGQLGTLHLFEFSLPKGIPRR
jgi:hypothetical protein